ncbi:protease S8 tripeptidyl peptidase I, putative [Talaromyces stipitatus ATCC 10500]|uniref:tripeptidyl-peptidase II n=1 Tax=Talaromyces stipitatus (strain ATCC 10500 / CBS 375.48 / QM 6759 / NRRL 1006) TaxID=441959 RepID=B8MCJ4_TALSN|nr:protease S8 tripeptidyl peptidase I, putative [Talaromyces stipitatus ATCC 10500]EED18810.1 protease S8 tripeptidyl peptidase I, putative [Talaromyces stipitatus ATCC 10500]
MLWQYLLVHTSVFSGALAASLSPVLHEKRDIPLPEIKQRIDGDAIIPVRIGLRQSNLHTGYNRLMEVSHPSSENYGKHLTKEEVHALFAPAEETLDTVKNWLFGTGLVDHSEIIHYENKGWLAIDMPAKHAETLLGTHFYEIESHNGDVRIGCEEYYLPAHVSSHVDYIKPGVKLSAPMKKKQLPQKRSVAGADSFHPSHPRMPHTRPPHYPGWSLPPAAWGLPPELQNCGVNITPTCIKALYDIPNPIFSQPENAMGLFETYDAFSQEDISLFFQHFATNVPAGTKPNVISVDGGTAPVAPNDTRNGGESDIDLDLAISLIYPQTVTVYQVDDLPNSSGETGVNGFLNTFLDSVDGSYCDYSAFGITGDSPGVDASYPDPATDGYKGQKQCGTYNLTRVVSISYGEAEVYLPKAYVERQCNEILKLGLQGHTILVASGDYGVASFPGSNGDAEGCLSSGTMNGTIYNPDYPAGCPYITAVGATRLYPNDTVHDAESAMQVNLTAFNIATGAGPTSPPYDFFATGGGFSNYFKPAPFQALAIEEYLKKDLPYQSLPYYEINADATNIGEKGGVYNRIGRGYPDVSANGAFLLTYVNQTAGTFFGTSLASPIFGAVVTLLNEARSAVGKGPIGFINPALYANPFVLNDITNGSNPNCGSQGFQASQGWDPVTGLGTPNFPRMLAYFLSLP